MGTITREREVGWFCPKCRHTTAGIKEENKTVCPLCKRELWQCHHCGQHTFGTLGNASRCHHCGGNYY